MSDFFRQADKDRSGDVSKKEFRAGISKLVDPEGKGRFQPTDYDAMFNEVDTDRSGKVQYDELDKVLGSKLNDKELVGHNYSAPGRPRSASPAKSPGPPKR